MTTHLLETPRQVGEAIGREICDLVRRRPDAVLCLAAGHTSLDTFDILVESQQQGLDWSRVRIVELDEWLGMSKHPEGCTGFLRTHIFSRLNLKESQLYLLNADTAEPERECVRMEVTIAELGGIDYIFLGMGQSGHLALNEPGCDFDEGVHVARLDPVTETTGQKYFSEQVALRGGLTLGARNILAARRAALAVTGAHKQEILLRFLESPETNALPATALRRHPDAALFLDKDAAALALAKGLLDS